MLGVTDQMRIAHEEIFGPVLPILPYRDMDDAIAYVNARPRTRALYYFGGDREERRKVLIRTASGNVDCGASANRSASVGGRPTGNAEREGRWFGAKKAAAAILTNLRLRASSKRRCWIFAVTTYGHTTGMQQDAQVDLRRLVR